MINLYLPRETGFSLIETLMVIAISTLIFVGLTRAIAFFYNANDYTIQQSAAIRSTSEGVEQLTQDIREASFAANGAYPVEKMASTSLSIFVDVDRDDIVEKVEYFLDGTKLKRTITAPTGTPPTYTGNQTTDVVSRSVRNAALGKPVFTYFRSDGSKITDLSQRKDLVFVTIQLIVNVDPNRKPENTTIRSSATLRNVNKPS